MMDSLKERAARLNISEQAMEMLAHLSDLEIRTQTCEDCKNVMTQHPGGAWRFTIHPIRCELCVRLAQERGETAHDARYVD